MSLGTPSIGTASNWYSQFETDITQLLLRLQDNTGNLIDAKDVRDSVWTLYQGLQDVASQSSTQSTTFNSTRRTTFEVGGLSRGVTFSNSDYGDLFKQMFESYSPPLINIFNTTNTTYQFGQTTPVPVLTYNITPNYSPLFSINFTAPGGSVPSIVPTGSDPETGTSAAVPLTYSITPTISELNVFTMSVVTQDALTFSATSSIVYNHKIYYGSIDLTSIGGFISGSASSVSATRTYLTDARIKGLLYSSLQTGFEFKENITFGTGSYFIYAHPSIYGELPQQGFYTMNMFSTDFTKIKDAYTFSNEFSYNTPYDIWISNTSYDDVSITVRHEG